MGYNIKAVPAGSELDNRTCVRNDLQMGLTNEEVVKQEGSISYEAFRPSAEGRGGRSHLTWSRGRLINTIISTITATIITINIKLYFDMQYATMPSL